MHKLIFALHLLFAIFTIGPLAHAATTAARGARTGDVGAIRSSVRMLQVYAGASVLAVLAGMGLVQEKWRAQFSDLWVWLSIALWVVAIVIVLVLLVPALQQALTQLEGQQPAATLNAKIAASGGVVGLIFVGIVFLMVYKPGR